MDYPDIYFMPSYANPYKREGEEIIEFRHETEDGLISNLFIKRPIEIELNDGIQYYDIITPYGYGGPIIHYSTNKENLIKSYYEAFKKYSERNNIISEFVRFHPLLDNASDFKETHNPLFDRKTVGTNLTYEDVIGTEFSKHKRKDIKKLLKNPDIKYEINDNPTSLDDFIDIYYSTMDRDEADSYYYFDSSYFHSLLTDFPNNIITCKVFLKDKLIAMGVYFKFADFIHAHLSGSLTEYLNYSPAYLLKYAMAIYGHEKGYRVIHYGGGNSKAPDNGLYKFKKDFGRNTEFDFFIAKKIWNQDVYEKLCKSVNADINSEFFPAYRLVK